MIQAVVLAEFGGLDRAQRLRRPSPASTTIRPSPNEDYFEHVDWIVGSGGRIAGAASSACCRRGATSVNKKWGEGPEIFTPENAASLWGSFWAERYRRQADHLDPRWRSARGETRARAGPRRHGRRAAQGRRRTAPRHAAPDGRARVGGHFQQRRHTRLGHSPERPRHRVHRPLRSHAARLPPRAREAGHRRGADL